MHFVLTVLAPCLVTLETGLLLNEEADRSRQLWLSDGVAFLASSTHSVGSADDVITGL